MDAAAAISQNVSFEFSEPEGNTAPAMDYVTLLDQTGYDVIVAAAATDADGHPLTYTYDWGDGSPLDVGQGTMGPTPIPISRSDRGSSPFK